MDKYSINIKIAIIVLTLNRAHNHSGGATARGHFPQKYIFSYSPK